MVIGEGYSIGPTGVSMVGAARSAILVRVDVEAGETGREVHEALGGPAEELPEVDPHQEGDDNRLSRGEDEARVEDTVDGLLRARSLGSNDPMLPRAKDGRRAPRTRQGGEYG